MIDCTAAFLSRVTTLTRPSESGCTASTLARGLAPLLPELHLLRDVIMLVISGRAGRASGVSNKEVSRYEDSCSIDRG